MAPFALQFPGMPSTKRLGAPVTSAFRRWRTVHFQTRAGNRLYADDSNTSAADELGQEDTISNKFIPFTSPSTLHAPVQVAETTGDTGDIATDPVPVSAPVADAAEATPTALLGAELEPSIQLSPAAIVSAVLGFIAVVVGLAVMMLTRTAWYRKKKSGSGSGSGRAGSRPSKSRKRAALFKRKELNTDSRVFKISTADEEQDAADEKAGAGSMHASLIMGEHGGSGAPTLYYYAIGTEAGDEDIADSLKYESTVGSMVSITYEAGLGQCAEGAGSVDGHGSEETHSSEGTAMYRLSQDLYSIQSTRTSMTSMVSSGEEVEEEEVGQVHRAQTQSMEIKRAVLVTLSASIT